MMHFQNYQDRSKGNLLGKKRGGTPIPGKPSLFLDCPPCIMNVLSYHERENFSDPLCKCFSSWRVTFLHLKLSFSLLADYISPWHVLEVFLVVVSRTWTHFKIASPTSSGRVSVNFIFKVIQTVPAKNCHLYSNPQQSFHYGSCLQVILDTEWRRFTKQSWQKAETIMGLLTI